MNFSTVTKELRVTSPQAGQVYAGVSPLSAKRMQREPLREAEVKTANTNQFLDAEMFARPPMTPHLSGLEGNTRLRSSTAATRETRSNDRV